MVGHLVVILGRDSAFMLLALKDDSTNGDLWPFHLLYMLCMIYVLIISLLVCVHVHPCRYLYRYGCICALILVIAITASSVVWYCKMWHLFDSVVMNDDVLSVYSCHWSVVIYCVFVFTLVTKLVLFGDIFLSGNDRLHLCWWKDVLLIDVTVFL